MNRFAFRAECQLDIIRFLNQNQSVWFKRCVFSNFPETPQITQPLPDMWCYFETPNTIGDIRNTMRQVVDSHVMIESLVDCDSKHLRLTIEGVMNAEGKPYKFNRWYCD